MKFFNKNNLSITKLTTINQSVVMCHVYVVDVNNRDTSVVLFDALDYTGWLKSFESKNERMCIF